MAVPADKIRQGSSGGVCDRTALCAEIVDLLNVGIAIYEAVHDDAAPDAVRFRLAMMNPEALAISRVDPDQAVGALLEDVFPGAESMGFVAALERVYRTGRVESLEALHYVDDRRDGWYRNDIYRLSDSRLMAVYTEVTEDHEAAAALKESETRYELLTESLADGIYDWNLVEDTIYFSPSWKAQLGYADHELENRVSVWEDLLHPEQRAQVLDELAEFVDGTDKVWDKEFQLRHKTGDYVWIHTRATPVRDEVSGRVLRLLGVHMNVDLEKRERLEVERQRATMDALFGALPDLFFLVDEDGVILDLHANHDVEFHHRPEELIGEPMQRILPDDVGVQFVSAIAEAKLSGQLVILEYALPMLGGTRHYESRITRTTGEQFAIVVRDISRRRMIEDDLQLRVRENEALSRLYRVAQHARHRRDILRMAPAPIAEAMHGPQRVGITVEIDGQREELGIRHADGRRIVSPIFDGHRTRGRVEVYFQLLSPPLKEEQAFLNTASQIIGVWLRGDDARRGLQTYERIVDNTQDQLALLDGELNYRVVNPAYAACYGLEPAEMTGRPLQEVLGEATATPLVPRLKRCLAGSHVQFQEWRSTPEGHRFMQVMYSPYREDEEVCGVIVSRNDVTELHEAQGRLRRAARVFSSAAEAVLMTRLDGTVTDVNAAFEGISGYSAAEAVGRGLPSILVPAGRSDDHLREAMEHAAKVGSWRGEVWNRRSSGEVFPALMTVSRVEDEGGAADGFVCVFSDISDIKQHEQRLESLANHDALTGLPNRTMLARHLENRVRRPQGKAEPFTLMFLDLDHFKPVNDRLGHSAGDKLLQMVTRRLRDVLRVDDLLTRVGGDEFVAVLPGYTSSANATAVADKIIATLHEPFSIMGEEVRIGVSIGISGYPEDSQDADALLRDADTAMYEAKSAGRNMWRCFNAEMNSRAMRHWKLIEELALARERGEQSMVYQPKFDSSGKRILGLEALMRWSHPELGEVPPAEFIDAAEQGGLINELDHWALESVITQIRRWQDQGLYAPRTSINISARTLSDSQFPDKLRKKLEMHGVRAASIRLEFSERVLLNRNAANRKVLAQLQELGISVSIDDFGTGLSSLVEITDLQVNEIKVKASLVHDAAHNRRIRSVVEAIIAIGRSLDLEIVATGVEDAEQAQLMDKLGPLKLQGFHFCKPLGTAACEELLHRSCIKAV
ncbi:MAG: EAL domain-containing protein [Halieaceae bacterium]|nr:EAL domain-containing protein [Halieaceae bacterium]